MKISESLISNTPPAGTGNVPKGKGHSPESGGNTPAAGEKAAVKSSATETAAAADHGTYVDYEVDQKTDTVVTKMISKKDGKVIREIPPDESLKLAAQLRQVVEKIRAKRIG